MSNLTDIDKLTLISDLMYYDGPLFSAFMDTDGKVVMIFWVGQNDVFNTWLLYTTTTEHLAKYKSGAIDLRSFILLGEKHEHYKQSRDDLHYDQEVINISDYQIYLPDERFYHTE